MFALQRDIIRSLSQSILDTSKAGALQIKEARDLIMQVCKALGTYSLCIAQESVIAWCKKNPTEDAFLCCLLQSIPPPVPELPDDWHVIRDAVQQGTGRQYIMRLTLSPAAREYLQHLAAEADWNLQMQMVLQPNSDGDPQPQDIIQLTLALLKILGLESAKRCIQKCEPNIIHCLDHANHLLTEDQAHAILVCPAVTHATEIIEPCLQRVLLGNPVALRVLQDACVDTRIVQHWIHARTSSPQSALCDAFARLRPIPVECLKLAARALQRSLLVDDINVHAETLLQSLVDTGLDREHHIFATCCIVHLMQVESSEVLRPLYDSTELLQAFLDSLVSVQTTEHYARQLVGTFLKQGLPANRLLISIAQGARYHSEAKQTLHFLLDLNNPFNKEIVELFGRWDVQVQLIMLLDDPDPDLVRHVADCLKKNFQRKGTDASASKGESKTQQFAAQEQSSNFVEHLKDVKRDVEALKVSLSMSEQDQKLFEMIALNLDDEETSSKFKVCEILGQQYIMPKHERADDVSSLVPGGCALIPTPTTLTNVAKILDSVRLQRPVLIEGPTGVGKSATIVEAARRMQQPLIRFNMSANVGLPDLIGGLGFDNNLKIQFSPGPLLQAWTGGIWLLLDELNLANPSVLSALETALDSSLLTVGHCAGADGTTVHKMHPHFRLFATQNPNTFVGRSRLPSSFVSRLDVTIMEPIPHEEWAQIAGEILKKEAGKGGGWSATTPQQVGCVQDDVGSDMVFWQLETAFRTPPPVSQCFLQLPAP